jgi:hypothetical protein
MRYGHKPSCLRSPLGEIQPLPVDAEAIKRAAWIEQGILIISKHDARLGWCEAQEVKNLGDKLYGKPNKSKAAL